MPANPYGSLPLLLLPRTHKHLPVNRQARQVQECRSVEVQAGGIGRANVCNITQLITSTYYEWSELCPCMYVCISGVGCMCTWWIPEVGYPSYMYTMYRYIDMDPLVKDRMVAEYLDSCIHCTFSKKKKVSERRTRIQYYYFLFCW